MRVGYARTRRFKGRSRLRLRAQCFLLPVLLLLLSNCDGPDMLTPPRTQTTPRFMQVSDDLHWTDWSEYATGVQPSGFVQVWDPSPYFKVVDDSAGSGKLLEWSSPKLQSRNRFGLAYQGAGDMTDQSVYTEVRVRSLLGSSGPWYLGTAAVRMTGTASAEGGYALWLFANATTRTVVLSTYTNGGYTQLAEYGLSWSNDVWYSVRLEAIGSTIRARIWEKGTPEPSTWQLERTHTAWPLGKPGVANHDNAVVQWKYWELRGAPPVEPPPVPVLTALRLLPDSVALPLGGSASFSAQGVFSDGSTTTVPIAFTASGGTISASGSYIAGQTPGTYAIIATHTGTPAVADTSRVTISAPSPGVTLTADFTADAVGLPPSGWTETAYPGNSSWVIATDAGVNDGRVLRNTTTSTGRHILRLDAAADTTTTQEIVVRMRMGDADGRGPGVALRHTMNGSLENAYVAYLRTANNRVEVNRFMNGGWLFIGDAPFVNQPGQWYSLRFRAEGNALKVKVWPAGSAEPAAWTREFVDNGLATGSAGLYTYEPNTVDYDGVGFAAGGASAPTPADGPPPPKTLVGIVVTPAAVSVAAGAVAQFSAYGRWSDGDSTIVPVNWQATGGTITAGGLFTAGTTAGTWQIIATHATLAHADTAMVTVTAMTTPPPAPPAGGTYSTGFSTDPLDQPPSGWTATAYAANSTWQVVVDNTASDNRVLRNVTTATGRHILRFDGVPDTSTTQEVLVKMRLRDSDNRGPGVALRHRMNGTRESAYVAYFRPGENVVEINRFLDGQWLYVGSARFVHTPGTWYWLRFRAEGTTLRVKAWADGTPEPSAWTHTANDAGIPSGSLGLYTYESNTVDYDQFGYALYGVAAARPMSMHALIR